jgi:hypothetical protein
VEELDLESSGIVERIAPDITFKIRGQWLAQQSGE